MADTFSFPDKLSFRIDNTGSEQFADHINDTGTTQTDGFLTLISDNRVAGLHRFRINGTCLDRAVRRTHTAADIPAFKSRSRRAGAAHHKIRIAEYKLAVKQRKFRTIPQHTYQSTCCDISAHITADIRCQYNMGIRIYSDSDIRSKQ